MTDTIGVIGTGVVGRALADGWTNAGHRVTLGSRHPSTHDAAGMVCSISDAIAEASVVVLAVPARALADLLGAHGPSLGDRLVIDATNALGGRPDRPENISGPMHQRELWHRLAPQVTHVRAFCTIGWEVMAEAVSYPRKPLQAWSGPKAAAPTVERLIADLGLQPRWVGPAGTGFEVLDGLARAWFTLALMAGDGRDRALLWTGPKDSAQHWRGHAPRR